MRGVFLSIVLLLASLQAALAGAPAGTLGWETVRKHIDLEVNANGSYLEAVEVSYRALTPQGVEALQQATLSYTQGYQSYAVEAAYTLKANGTRIPVPPSGYMMGNGDTSMPGFEDTRMLTIVFPNVEVGDCVVLVTLFRQYTPWFEGQFAEAFNFTREVASHDVQISLTQSTQDAALHTEAVGFDGGVPETVGGKTRRTWFFHNDTPIAAEDGAVDESDDGPHIAISSFSGYGAVAQLSADHFSGKETVTPEIEALADKLTAGISDRREQARALYEWVSTHISYVNIVLGAGGFTPHEAPEVLANLYGDCKDHAMLLGALLAAKGIKSSPVLINADNSFHLSDVASPFLFNHLITYIPKYHLFLDSTARYTPFGVLPDADAGKPVLLVDSGEIAQTPPISSHDSKIGVVATVKFSPDGTAEGTSRISANGAAAMQMRAMMNASRSMTDNDYFRATLGPGADGTLDRGDIASLSPAYSFSASYRQTNVAAFPGPGAVPSWPGYKPFYFGSFIAGSLPPQRARSYVCPSITASDDVTIEFPQGVQITSQPKTSIFRAQDIELDVASQNLSSTTIRQTLNLQINHPGTVCTAEYYNRVRGDLEKMIAALRAQIIYK